MGAQQAEETQLGMQIEKGVPEVTLQGKALHTTEVRETEQNREKSGKTSWGPSGKNTTQPWMVFLCVHVCISTRDMWNSEYILWEPALSFVPGNKLQPSGFGSTFTY